MPRSHNQRTRAPRSTSNQLLSRGDVRSFLSKQSKERLIELLVDAAFENEGLLGTLSLDMTGTLGGGRALASLRATIDEAIEMDRYFGYGETFAYATRLESVARTLR